MTKICTKCKVEKDETLFHYRGIKESRQSWCKECMNKNSREYALKRKKEKSL